MIIKLLLLEDDSILQEIIQEYLVENGYLVDSFFDGGLALDAAISNDYDLLLLDVNVPSIDGFEMLEYLRDIQNSIPVIFITSLSGIKSLKKAFELGVDDYLKKPFELEELNIRIQHQLHIAYPQQKILIGKSIFYPDEQCIEYKNQKVKLMQKESQILLYLIQKKGSIATLDELIVNVWSNDTEPAYATIRTYIKNLRKLLDDHTIENIKGVGYRFNQI